MQSLRSQTGVIVVLAIVASIMVGLFSSGGTAILRQRVRQLLPRSSGAAAVAPAAVIPTRPVTATPTLTPSPTATPTPTGTPVVEATPTAAPTEVPPTPDPALAAAAPAPDEPPAEPPPPEGVTLVIAIAGRLNIRQAPTTDATVLVSLPQGTELAVVGRTADGEWMQVQLPDAPEQGWVSGSPTFVTIQGNPDTLPVTSDNVEATPSAHTTPSRSVTL